MSTAHGAGYAQEAVAKISGVFYLQDCNDSSKTQGTKDPYIGSGADTPARMMYIYIYVYDIYYIYSDGLILMNLVLFWGF